MKLVSAACVALFALLAPARALIINLDYTYDIQDGNNFFGTHPTAKATLEQAAADLGVALGSGLSAVTRSSFTGTSGAASVTLDWTLSINNPVTNAEVDFSSFNEPANTVTIYVGMRPLSGSTLGVGGPAGVANLGLSFSGSGTNLQKATDNAVALSDGEMDRGAGPVIGTLSGTIGTASYTAHYGAILGNLWFDDDSNNDGSVDNFTMLDNYWHFELAAPMDGQNDFYSVALHEMMHALGFGTSDSWKAEHSGTTWLGSNAKALNGGSGANLVTTDGHAREGLMSARLSDGVLQEVVMDPSLTQGTRKLLTQMDLGFMRDIGYAAAPEPSSGALFVTAIAMMGVSRRRR